MPAILTIPATPFDGAAAQAFADQGPLLLGGIRPHKAGDSHSTPLDSLA